MSRETSSHRFFMALVGYPTVVASVGFILWMVLTGGRP